MSLKQRLAEWKIKRVQKRTLDQLYKLACKSPVIQYDTLSNLYTSVLNKRGIGNAPFMLKMVCTYPTSITYVQNPKTFVDDFSFTVIIVDDIPDVPRRYNSIEIVCRTDDKKERIIFVSVNTKLNSIDYSENFKRDFSFCNEIGVNSYTGVSTTSTNEEINVLINNLHDAFSELINRYLR